jgi:hypothetical protein
MLTYVRNTCGNRGPVITGEQIKAYRDSTEVRTPWSAEELMEGE